ncbi:DNA mismatch repair endonuclease MutL [Clostridioides mangenotii]|uniref:DNA mismatch repair endonuclease MutL n=1 Tax=Metaclostridioides mangenotii TaxID=1540 RepID=UPI001C11B8A1|nr:DNA mismatch repair endonuclease MutL [Clostridioides mangenotii]
MMNRINILDDITINKIAAGEVVERPSSVLKELVENSIDANSTKISIEIKDGGKESIKIVDNGDGIDSSELEKCFLRHATSKIKNVDDLYEIYSLGFRGEAMSSISAVSKLEMITKAKDEPIGTKISLEGGKIVSKDPIGTPNGTTITIKELFFNTPARKKFLKSTHAETINISDWINKLAIGNPSIQFKYINNGRNMLNTPGDGNLLSAIRSIYGKEVSENLIDVNFESRYFKVNGFISNNNLYRSNKNLQHIYINNRFVKSKVVLNALTEGYKSIIPIGKHAVCFLNVFVDPSKVDVNIHPNKLEVKFEKEHEIYIELRDYLQQRLLRSNLIGKYKTYDNKKSIVSNGNLKTTKLNDKASTVNETRRNSFGNADNNTNDKAMTNSNIVYNEVNKNNDQNKTVYDVIKETKKVFGSNINNEDTSMNTLEEFNKSSNFNPVNIDEVPINEFQSVSDVLNSYGNIEELIIKKSEEKPENIQGEFTSKNKIEFINEEENGAIQRDGEFSLYLADYIVVGVLFKTYIVLEKRNSMFLLDQHAAHERILFERYMDKFYRQDINMQMLIDPIVMEVSNVDMLYIEENLDLFMKFGFEVEIFGKNHVMVRSVPTIFGVPETEKFILQIIDNLEDIKSNYDLKVERFASMACRSAIKAHDKIYDLEIKSLFEQLEKCDNPFTCPHGRPIIVEISNYEIEKMFKRVM